MTKWTPGGEALTELFLEVFRTNGALLSEGDRIAGEYGQSSARWQVLGAIDAEPLTVPGIAREMGLTRQSVQRTVDVLEGDGLVEYQNNPAHLRSRLVAMTAEGRKTYDAISKRQADWANSLAQAMGLSERQIRSAVTVLEKLGRTVEKRPTRRKGSSK
jgi:DNA-binding MarR family transcriptional regulator